MVSDARLTGHVARLSIFVSLFFATSPAGTGQAAGAAGVSVRPAATTPAYTGIITSPSPPAPTGQAQSPFQGSAPTGRATGTTLALTLKDAFDRALKYNLGAIQSDQNTRAARAERLRNLSALLPTLSGQVTGTVQQINLQANGIRLISVPGVRIPTLVGPFSVADARAYLSQRIFNLSDIKNWRSAAQSETAALYSYKSDRDLVVQITA